MDSVPITTAHWNPSRVSVWASRLELCRRPTAVPAVLRGRTPVDSHQEHVLREVAQKSIRRLWFTDVAGVLKVISIDPGELEDTLRALVSTARPSGLLPCLSPEHAAQLPDASTFHSCCRGVPTRILSLMFCDVSCPMAAQRGLGSRGLELRVVEARRRRGFRIMMHQISTCCVSPSPPEAHGALRPRSGEAISIVARGVTMISGDARYCMLEDIGRISHHEEAGRTRSTARWTPVRTADNIAGSSYGHRGGGPA